LRTPTLAIAGRPRWLCKYVLRPPIAQERVHLGDGGLVRLELRRPFKDGTIAVDLDPLRPLCRLAASVPPPKMHTARFAGVLSASHRFRSVVVLRALRLAHEASRASNVGPASIERFLRHLGEPVEPLPLSPARGRPFFNSRAVRRKFGELGLLPQQIEMFGG
jgi:hypothetical protein